MADVPHEGGAALNATYLASLQQQYTNNNNSNNNSPRHPNDDGANGYGYGYGGGAPLDPFQRAQEAEAAERAAAEAEAAKERAKKPPEAPKEPMTYLSYHGWLDYQLGISMFWADKFILLILYLQRIALVMLWDLDWPNYFSNNFYYIFIAMLDFTAHHDGVVAIGNGSLFEGCEVVCKIVWPVVCCPIILVWACLALHKTLPLYYSRNIERILWTLLRLLLLPFCNTIVRYFILNQNGDLTNRVESWATPSSEIGTGIGVITLLLFLFVGYVRSARPVLFRSRIRHEAFVRAREIEYKLKFSATYRNDRVWMVSSYFYHGWPWSLVRGFVDVGILLIINFVPPKIGIIIACVVYGLEFLYLFFVDIYRCYSTTIVEQIYSLAMFIFVIFGAIQVYGTRNVLLEDGRNLDYFLFALHAGAVVLTLLLNIYFFISSHTFGLTSIADRRAHDKWKRTFGTSSTAGQWLELDAVHLSTKGEDKTIDHRTFIATKSDLTQQKKNSKDRFYLPKQSTFFSLNCESPHVWPVNGVMINEMLRRNEEDHLIDLLRAARRMLDRISIMHNSADLIPTDEIKTHIVRLQQCVQYCKRMRVTHHVNAIHPLQTTFEDMIEQFTFELRVFSGRSVTVGHNARRMIEVSRYLRLRMEARDRSLALVSPLMRRILIKLLALRLFIQLIEAKGQPAGWIEARRRAENQREHEDVGNDIGVAGESESDDDYDYEASMNPNGANYPRRRQKRLRFQKAKAVPEKVDVFESFENNLGIDDHGRPIDVEEDEREQGMASLLAKKLAAARHQNNGLEASQTDGYGSPHRRRIY